MDFLVISKLFYVDILTKIMLALVVFVSCVVWLYSKNYMQGDTYKNQFLYRIILQGIAVSTMVAADNMFLFLGASITSNLLLIQLMIHKIEWKSAKASGSLALKHLSLSFVLIACGFVLLYAQTGKYQIQDLINESGEQTANITIGLIVIFFGIMLQSAQWPFHRWLISSLNSPTPVSAIMHAGIINGGGFLLIRFAPLYIKGASILNLIFVIGVVSAFLGTLLKLAQNDYKRMLASSTMGQMGFMIMQCGLGLFSAAFAHLCWHGIFKAYLFLISGSAAQGIKQVKTTNPRLSTFLLAAVLGGALGTYIFSHSSGTVSFAIDTTIIIKGIVFIAATQLSLTILSCPNFINIILSILMTFISAGIYGGSIRVFHILTAELNLDYAQPLNTLHIIGFTVFLLSWLLMTFRQYVCSFYKLATFREKLYVVVLNACQPHASTITTSRSLYNYQRRADVTTNRSNTPYSVRDIRSA